MIGGALAAHGHSDWSLPLIDTASRFQLIHALALLGAGVMLGQGYGRWAMFAGVLFAVGILLFCGGLYVDGFMSLGLAGHVAPAGGMTLIAGWLALGLAGLRRA